MGHATVDGCRTTEDEQRKGQDKMTTAYKVRTVQRTRTLTSGEKYTHKYYVGLFVEPVGEWQGTWRELPNYFSDRKQALRIAKLASQGEYLP